MISGLFYLPERKNKVQLSLIHCVSEVSGDVFLPLLVRSLEFGDITNLCSAIKRSPNCLPVHFVHLKLKDLSKLEKVLLLIHV